MLAAFSLLYGASRPLYPSVYSWYRLLRLGDISPYEKESCKI